MWDLLTGLMSMHFKKSSVGFSAGLGLFTGSIASAASLEYRFYPSKTNLIPMKGLYIGPHLFAYNYEGDGNVALGALIGYQWIWKSDCIFGFRAWSTIEF